MAGNTRTVTLRVLGDSKDAERALARSNAATERLVHAVDRLTGKLGDASATAAAHAGVQKRLASAIEDTTDELRQQARRFGTASRAAKSYTRTLLLTAAATTALSALAGGAAAATAAIVALAAALAPAAGTIVAFPGLIAGAAAAMVTLKVALFGVSDAFKAALGDDPEAYAEALKKLSPAARGVAGELRALRPALESVRKSVQNAFFEQLTFQLAATARVLAGPLKQGMVGVASSAGAATRELAVFAREAATVGAIRNIFGDMRRNITAVTPAIQPLLRGLRDIAVVGSTFLSGLVPGLAAAGRAFGQWLSQVSASGQAMAWMQGALDVLKQLGSIVGNVAGIFVSFGQAAGAVGGGILNTLVRLTGEAKRFFASAQGQEVLRNVFAALRDIGGALLPVLRAAAVGVGQLAPMIGRLAVAAGPVLTRAIEGLVPVILALEPGLMALVRGFGQAVDILVASGGLTAIAKALSQVLVATAPLLPILASFAAVLAQQVAAGLMAIAPQLPALVTAFRELLVALVPLLPPVIDLAVQLVPLVPLLIGMAAAAANFAASLPAPVLQLGLLAFGLTKVAGPAIGVVGKLGMLGGAAVRAGGAVSSGAGRIAASMLAASGKALIAAGRMALSWIIAMGPIAIVIAAVIGIVALIIANWDRIKKFTAKAWKWIWDRIGGFMRGIRDTVAAIVATIVARVQGFARGVTAAVGWLGRLPGRVTAWFGRLASGALNQAGRLLAYVRGLPGRIARAIGGLGRTLYNAGRNLISGLLSGVRGRLTALWNEIKGIANRVRSFWPFSPAKEGPLKRFPMEKAGANLMTGLAEGIGRGTGSVTAAAHGAAAAASGVIAPARPGGGSAARSGFGLAGAAAGGSAGPVVIEIRSGGSRLDDALVEVLRKAISDRGGSVQAVLGRR